MDWGKYALCQEHDIDLLDLLQNKNSDIDCYSKLAANIEPFLNRMYHFQQCVLLVLLI